MKNNLARLFVLSIVLAGIGVVVTYREHLDATALQSWIENAGAAAPLLFMLIYIVGTVFFFPGSVLTLLGGALFGPVLGTLYNLTAATIGAMLSFLASRFLASNWVANKTGGRLKQLINGVEGEGWRFVAFVRLVPLFPFNLLNYALGLTRISFTQYSIATYIFMLPGAIAYTYLGYIGREAATGGEGLIQKGLLALALLAVVSFMPRMIAAIRRGPAIDIAELKQRIDNNNALVLDVRTATDFIGEQGHIENAVNIAVEELPARMNELSEFIERPIAIVCRTDKRSAKAALILTQQGFHDVHVVRGGMTKWLEAGLPVAR